MPPEPSGIADENDCSPAAVTKGRPADGLPDQRFADPCTALLKTPALGRPNRSPATLAKAPSSSIGIDFPQVIAGHTNKIDVNSVAMTARDEGATTEGG